MAKRDITLQITVRVPATIGENEVETALNAVLDEEPGVDERPDWGEWIVGPLTVIDAQPAPDDDEEEV